MDWPTILLTTSLSLAAAIMTAFLAARWTQRREQEADWRKLKLIRYQDFVDATSGLIEGRSTNATIIRFHDTANSLLLVAPKPVLEALWAFFDANMASNPNRLEEAPAALDVLIRAMRRDVRPRETEETSRQFEFIRPPPGVVPKEI
ncbi:hypothetical protein [Xanthobacter sp.]|uniref:hypothetical protein n=1 Tax=Xanthobacter sp. TaxID=35809 RepID=UPI0035AF08A7